MSATRPALRNVFELRVPVIPQLAAEWAGVAMKLATDVLARANRQWVDLWFSNANHAMNLWWGTLRSRTRALR